MSKRNTYVVYAKEDLYEKDRIGDTANDTYNIMTFRVVGVYDDIDIALDRMNQLNVERYPRHAPLVWQIKCQKDLNKLISE